MTKFRILLGITTTMLIGLFVAWIVKNWAKEPLPVSPDIHMMTECDSFVTAVHLFNPDERAMKCSYRVYVDSNDNQLLDSNDIFICSEPPIRIGPFEEYKGMVVRPLTRYKRYSLIVQAKTEDLVAYYASIPCDVNTSDQEYLDKQRDSTPTK